MKFTRFLVCLALLLSSVSGVFAEKNTGVEEALTEVKNRIDTSQYTEFNSEYYKDDEGKVSYSFNWSNDDEELYVEFEEGIISNYSKYIGDYDSDTNAFSVGESEAIAIAEEFIKRINPDICENIKIVPDEKQSIYYNSYELELYRTENGIPVLGQNGYISVSKKTKEVSGFYISYNPYINFKSADKIISEDDAKEAYKKLLPPVLRYKIKRDYSTREISAYLEYAPKDSSLAINAYDGEVYSFGYGEDIVYNRSMAAEEAEKDAGGFTPAEREETERIAGLLSEEEIIGIAKRNEFVNIPKDFECEYIYLNRNIFNKNEYTYALAFSDEDDYISVSLDAKTGEITSFSNYTSDEKKDKKDRKTEEEKAQKAFSLLAGEKASEFRIAEQEYEGFVEFVRNVDGIDVIGDGAYFDFDNADNITCYSLSYTKDVEFPSKNGVISSDDAAETAFEKVGFIPAYAIDDENKTAQPIYCIGKNADIESFMINPFTANLIDYRGNDVTEGEKFVYTDIEGHYGKQAFSALAEYGIGFGGGKLKPDEAITQSEYFVLLNKAFGYEADKDEIYRRMIRYGTISADERADDSVLTRENAAIFMIREMGAEQYAKFNDIFVAPFDDVTENKGYIAILKAEKIVNGDGSGNFYPQKTVTRGEALIMIYNYFTK